MVTPLKRVALLLCMALLLVLTATISASSELQQQQHHQETTAEAIDVDDTLSAAVSGCALCQRTGQCDQAFRGTPGQFCQTLVSAAPCCCPADAQCVLDNAYNCRCRRTVVSSSPNVRSVTRTTTSSSSSGSTMIFFLLFMICCVCCCCGAAEKRHRRHEREYQYAQPVYTAQATQYGTNDQYAYPSAPPMYEERSYPGGGDNNNNSGFVTGAVGAVAGLAAGAFLGSAFSRNGDDGSHQQTSTSTSYFAGDSGGATSTFDFSGDTGGDDGGDFAGDS